MRAAVYQGIERFEAAGQPTPARGADEALRCVVEIAAP